jgi:hypothetical protein
LTQDQGIQIPAQWVKWALEVGGDPFRIERSRRMTLELMETHGVGDWALRIGHGKDEAGSIRYRKSRGKWDGQPGTLTLSGPLMSLWIPEQARDTALHEIAHIMAPDDGHGPVWRHHVRRIGGRPVRLWGEAGENQIEKPWKGTCPGGHPHRPRRQRPRQQWSCTACHPGEFDARFVITWTKE